MINQFKYWPKQGFGKSGASVLRLGRAELVNQTLVLGINPDNYRDDENATFDKPQTD
jgi:hypothetical protein